MKETSLYSALHESIFKISDRNLTRNLDSFSLKRNLSLSSGQVGAIALLRENGQYELTKYARPEIQVPDITFDDLWTCTQEHFGLTAATAGLAYGGMPVRKIKKGHGTWLGSGKYTNEISDFGHKYFPKAKLKNGTPAAGISKAVFGTTRVFGIIGRASPFAAIGFAVFDIVSIGMCALEERNGS